MDWRFPILIAATMLDSAAWGQFPNSCTAFPNNCLYSAGPALTFATTTASFTYRDDTQELRTVELFIRTPIGVSGALPVVVWSPAAGAPTAAADVMSRWSETTARAGYLSVSVSHALRDVVDRASLCRSQGLDEPQECFGFDPVNWDWPNDLREVLNWLERVNQAGPAEVRGRIDMRRIAVAGFADGSSGAISLAGARRMLTAQSVQNADDFSDPRPVAFVGLSPQGPVLEGFFDTEVGRRVTSWSGIERPVLTVTGSGDNSCNQLGGGCSEGDTPSRRRIPFEVMPEGGKYELFVDSVLISHDLIGTLDTARCAASGVTPAQCISFDEWLRATVMAFLDAHVRERTAAQTWLKNGLIQAASGGVAIWSSK